MQIWNQQASFEAGISVILDADEKCLSAVSWITLRRSETEIEKILFLLKKNARSHQT